MTDTGWTFLSNHAHVVAVLDRDPGTRLRDLADQVGITERAVSRILAELEAAGVISRERRGRRNLYRIRRSARLRHPIEAHRSVGDLLRLTSQPADRVDPGSPPGGGGVRSRHQTRAS